MGEIRAYPGLAQIEQRCISMLAHLFNVPVSSLGDNEDTATTCDGFYGTSTVGSSEGILLAGLAMKRRWQEMRRSQGKSDYRPNIIIGSNAHTVQHKFANYFDVEERVLDVTEEDLFGLNADMVAKNVDENTIGVFTVLGNNYTGHFDNIAGIAEALDHVERQTGYDIPIHVDAAVGGFVAPFSFNGDTGPKW
jgi:glutamate decarboxylase